jgi:hypothetical protein
MSIMPYTSTPGPLHPYGDAGVMAMVHDVYTFEWRLQSCKLGTVTNFGTNM